MTVAMAAHAVSEPPRSVTVDAAIMQIDEPRYLGARLRAETVLTDSEGRDFALGDMLGKPVILLLSYYGCDGTCPTMNMELAKVLSKVERFRLGEDYRVLTVSFDARDSDRTAADFLSKTGAVVPDLARDGWRHAVIKSRDVSGFAGEIGYRFFWSDAAKAFMHPNVLVFLTPQGRVARYIYGTRMDARTVELALTDADWERISNSAAVFDILAGACFSYNYTEGRYEPNYAQLIGIGSFLLGVTLMGYGAWAYSRGRRRRATHVQ
ncbi:MAG: SCO family protein [Sulfuritalea sp.]|nr:SCO family protein [Sulfuritalea sp.]